MLVEVLENRKVTGPVIGILVVLVVLLLAWKSGVEPQKRSTYVHEETEAVPAQKLETKSPATFSEDLDSYVTQKRTYEFQHVGTKYRRECRLQAVATSSCTRLSCTDGKIYCVSSYMEL